MSEANSRRTVVDNFRALGADCQRIEDSLSVGIPDLNLCFRGREGWVEFKHLDEHDLPKRTSTPIRIGLKKEQALWLKQRSAPAVSGNVAVLTKIEPRTWMLHTDYFNDLRDGLTMDGLRQRAAMVWEGDFKPKAAAILQAILLIPV